MHKHKKTTETKKNRKYTSPRIYSYDYNIEGQLCTESIDNYEEEGEFRNETINAKQMNIDAEWSMDAALDGTPWKPWLWDYENN